MDEMGLLSRLKSAFSEPPLIDELVTLTGRHEFVTNRLARHAALLTVVPIKRSVTEIAEREQAHQKRLRAILAERGLWPRPPESEPRDGANHWERLSGDLEMLLAFAQELNAHALKWEGGNPKLRDELLKIANEAAISEIELRRIAAKCDPQALD